jgi:hypothetical protein
MRNTRTLFLSLAISGLGVGLGVIAYCEYWYGHLWPWEKSCGTKDSIIVDSGCAVDVGTWPNGKSFRIIRASESSQPSWARQRRRQPT